MDVYRQGDITLIPVVDREWIKRIKAKGKPRTSRILRRGENGGVHMLEAPTVTRERVPESTLVEMDGTLYVLSPSGVRVVHREHKPITLPKGTFEVRPQRESRDQRERQVYD
jgi:hypothetical protein